MESEETHPADLSVLWRDQVKSNLYPLLRYKPIKHQAGLDNYIHCVISVLNPLSRPLHQQSGGAAHLAW